LTKGKPWSIELEKQLRDLVEAKTSLSAISKLLGKPEEAVRQKIRRLGLEAVVQKKIVCSTTSSELVLPQELPSVEETLKKLSAALNALETPGLEKSEVMRLRAIIQAVKVYKELLTDYMNYRGLEVELMELSKKYEQLTSKDPGAPLK
jgi:DNA-binding Lrp family transcriptional regulator